MKTKEKRYEKSPCRDCGEPIEIGDGVTYRNASGRYMRLHRDCKEQMIMEEVSKGLSNTL